MDKNESIEIKELELKTEYMQQQLTYQMSLIKELKNSIGEIKIGLLLMQSTLEELQKEKNKSNTSIEVKINANDRF